MSKKYIFTLSLWISMVISPIVAQKRMGCLLDSTAYERIFLANNPNRGDIYQNLPKSHSLKNYCPIPKNQGEYGTCVAWTSAYYARSIMLAQKYHWKKEEINQKAGSPFFVYENIKAYNDRDCQDGAGLIIALESLKQQGTVPFHTFYKPCGDFIDESLRKQSDSYKIGEYRRLFVSNAKDKISPLKKSIAEGKPVVIGLQCFFDSFIQAKDSIWQPAQNELDKLNADDGGHALTVLGYNDEMQAFEVVNSWGDAWANKGFIWIPYEYFSQICFEAYQMYEPEEPATQIAGSIHLSLSAGMEVPLRLKKGFYESTKNYQSGTLLQLKLTNQEPAYIYAFSANLEKEFRVIFPLENKEGLLYKAEALTLPNEHSYISLYSEKNTEYFCILYSREKLHLPSLFNQLQYLEGDFVGNIYKVLGSKAIPTSSILFNSIESVKFSGHTNYGNIIPIVIAIKKKEKQH
ncbi:MAG: C1 family peptidase [Thermonemataceae bacterium]|nr:C1 family peptidase [Thermonemataceae bacterium]